MGKFVTNYTCMTLLNMTMSKFVDVYFYRTVTIFFSFLVDSKPVEHLLDNKPVEHMLNSGYFVHNEC